MFQINGISMIVLFFFLQLRGIIVTILFTYLAFPSLS